MKKILIYVVTETPLSSDILSILDRENITILNIGKKKKRNNPTPSFKSKMIWVVPQWNKDLSQGYYRDQDMDTICHGATRKIYSYYNRNRNLFYRRETTYYLIQHSNKALEEGVTNLISKSDKNVFNSVLELLTNLNLGE